MIRDLAQYVGRRLSFGVVPNWNGEWPLTEHLEYCGLVCESADELLLHGYFHRRKHGRGPTTLLVDGSDEMNGLDAVETQRTLERGQQVFAEVFGAPARGFIAPAWQLGHVRAATIANLGLHHVLGFFSLESAAGERIPLATWTWDCGRWGWLGHIGHAVGRASQMVDRGVPVLAIHPADIERGFWPRILWLTRLLLEKGYEPTTPTQLLEAITC
jgi:hypothetical protein